LVRRILVGWVDLVRRSALVVVLLSALASAAALAYAIAELGINTSTKDMLSQDLPFRQNDRAMDAAFPQLDQQILVVVEAASSEQAEDAARRIAEGLAARRDQVQGVFYPEDEPFFRRNGLLYLGLDELQSLADRLAEAQPLLAALNEDMSLRGLAAVLALTRDNGDETAAADLAPALESMAETVESLAVGRPAKLSWQGLLTGRSDGPESRRRLISARPVLDYSSLEPARAAIAGIRNLVRELGFTGDDGVRVRITGESVMLQDELKSVQDGIGMVGLLSFVLVSVLLTLGLRSLRLVAGTLLTLIAGLCWTAGFATLAVGELNLISVAFAVLFIGLSVDFGIHFSLRVEEEVSLCASLEAALKAAASGVGGALALTAVAAAIGFFSFLPTSYRGLSELGLISGVGMFVALLANLTVLPAMLALLPPGKGRRAPTDLPAGRLEAAVERHARAIAWSALLLALLAASTLPWARFDDDPLNLRDPDSPSVATLLDIIEDSRVQPYDVRVLTPGPAAAAALAERLKALPEVAKTVTLMDYLPGQQDEKLIVIEDMTIFLAPLWGGARVAPPTAGERRQAFGDLRRIVTALAEGPAGSSAGRLAAALATIDDSDGTLVTLERSLLANLPSRLAALGEALEAAPVALEDLPAALVSRKLAADGRSTVEVHPAEDLRGQAARLRFVDAVQSVVPEATGAPIIITEAGRAVVEAFLQAAGIALLLISLLLLAILRSVRDSLLVLAPLVVAALLTVAVTVVFNLPFNFANVIVLPLLFGLGVAGGVHMVARSRNEAATALMSTSTPRAVLFSALTTIGSFGALALSSHRGTASMGELLTIAIGLSMLSCLIVLPALLVLSGKVTPPPDEVATSGE